MQEPKVYWSHPRYLLCIKSRLQISADDPGMPLNNADVLVGDARHSAGVHNVASQGAFGEKFFQLLAPTASALQSAQQFLLTCHLGRPRALEK